MPIAFPTTGLSPGVTTYTYQGHTWLWSGTVWQSVGTLQGTQGLQGLQGNSGQVGTSDNVTVEIVMGLWN